MKEGKLRVTGAFLFAPMKENTGQKCGYVVK